MSTDAHLTHEYRTVNHHKENSVQLFDKLVGDKSANFFTVVGTIVSMIGMSFPIYVFNDDDANYTTTGVSKLQEAAAKIIAPSGFVVQPSQLGFVPSGNDFATTKEKPLLVTDEKIPFMIMSASASKHAYILLNGAQKYVTLGKKQKLNNQCSVWLYAIQDDNYSFKMMCS